MIFKTIFSRFFVVLGSENDSNIDIFSPLFRKRRFCENHCFSLVKLMILRVRASKKRPKIDAKTRSKKASTKNVPKLDFGLRFGLPNRPNIQKNRKNTRPEKSSKKTALGLTATYCKASLLGPRRTIQPSFQ